jgi:hypothetical protein
MNTLMSHNTGRGERAASEGLSLRGALGYLARSAMELHRYRYLRTRILHDSLSKLDRRACGKHPLS